MRQMPSVTEITVPSVRFSAATSRFWIFVLISSLISEGLICIAYSSVERYGARSAAAIWARASRTESVDDLVADLHARAAQQLGVHASSASTFLP